MPQLANIVDKLAGNSFARVYAIFNMTYSLGMIAGPWVVGLVKFYFGFILGMGVITIWGLVYAPIFLYFASSLKQIEHKSPPVSESTSLLETTINS